MARKNLVNSVFTAVEESLTGWSMAFPHLEFHSTKRVVLAPLWREPSEKVTVICGGGSGHEPFAAGFVGSGMLNAAIAGSIFASPPSSNILYALKCVSMNNKAGTVVIIPNYTGDCLNFGLAIEKAKLLGLKVNDVIVAEDCSIPESEQGRAGRRGLCGILFVMKTAGALAKRGHNLEDVTKYAKIVAQNMATYGAALTACTLPGQGLMFEIPADEIEFGLGIHGEAGLERKKLERASKVVAEILKKLTEALSLVRDDSVAVIVNNFGGLSQLENGIIINEVVRQLQSIGIQPLRVYGGILMSSLDSVGVHISILKLPENEKSIIISCLDDPTDAPQWPGNVYSPPPQFPRLPFEEAGKTEFSEIGKQFSKSQEHLFKECLRRASLSIITEENFINDLDRGCGDGDCGSTLKQLADSILSSLDIFKTSHPSSVFTELSYIAEEKMGGTSGALYGLMFTLAAKEFANGKDSEWRSLWHSAWRTAIDGVMRHSKAQLGDKTMLDAMDPGCKELENNLSQSLPYTEVVKKIVKAVQEGCEATKNLVPKAGRASYVKQAEFLKQADAGAYAVSIWIQAVATTLNN
ncbi:triokinase/FMN cyclase-like isoform X2 [Belonocnema kinseyi]|nr:triokinase/FMN cyclase-like isoform X2 [Belonocnema kinseyi]